MAKSFSDAIRDFAEKAIDRTEATTQLAALEVTRRVVKRTPVDTGRARANWTMTLDQPETRHHAGRDKTGAATVAAAAGVLASAQTSGRTIWLSNNLPYITRLEEGHSERGAHMLALTAAEWPDIVRASVRLAKVLHP